MKKEKNCGDEPILVSDDWVTPSQILEKNLLIIRIMATGEIIEEVTEVVEVATEINIETIRPRTKTSMRMRKLRLQLHQSKIGRMNYPTLHLKQ